MSDSADRIEALIHAQAILIQDLYAQLYAARPGDLEKCKHHLINMLKYKWELPAGSSAEAADSIMRIQPLAVAELERNFSQIRKMIRSMPPLPN